MLVTEWGQSASCSGAVWLHVMWHEHTAVAAAAVADRKSVV